MGLFSSSSKKIYRDDFKEALRKVPQLSHKERSYIEGVFSKPLENGLSEYEVKKEIGRLKHVSGDPLDSFEIEKLKQKLSEYF